MEAKVQHIFQQLKTDLTFDEMKKLSELLKKHLQESKLEEIRKVIHAGNLRKIILIVQGHQYFKVEGKPSSYEYILLDEETGQAKKKVSQPMKEETANRAIILAIIDALNRLNKDRKCYIRVYTKGTWGFTKMSKDSKGVNGDLLLQLHKLIEERQDVIEAEVNSTLVNQYLVQRKNKLPLT